jgi:N-acetylmuramoyl-L-alanine amidase
LKSRTTTLCLLVGLICWVTGCSTSSRFDQGVASDWADGDADAVVETVSESPEVAMARDIDPGSQANVAPQTSTWVSLARWARENEAGTVLRPAAAPANTFTLRSPAGVLEIQTRNLAAKWNGVALRLGFEPQLVNGQPFVHALDLAKNIQPLLGVGESARKPVRTVVIDPGHGGSSSGTRSVIDGSEEKSFTLDWARRLAPLLAVRGWNVHLTRTDDSEVSLAARVAIADQVGADLFISLHFNSAAPSQEQSGLETFCLTPTGMPSTLTRGFEDDVRLEFPNNAFDAENVRLAMTLQRSLLKSGAFVDRGVRRARFLAVLRGQNRPAALIEAGFLSNPAEARRIADPLFRQTLAEGVAAALLETWSPVARESSANPASASNPGPVIGPIFPRAKP